MDSQESFLTWKRQPEELLHQIMRSSAVHLSLVAVILAGIAWQQAAGNTYRPVGILAWLLSIACWIVAWWDGALPRLRPEIRAGVGRFVLAAALVLLVAAVFRFYRLAGVPPEMTSDHAEKLLDVRDVLNGTYRIFFPRNTGREPAQFYVTALLAGPLGFGLSYMALKVGTALVGWLTVPLTIWMVRWGAGLSRRTALLAGLFLAISKWHVEITRVGLRFPYTPLAVTLVLGFTFRALRFGRRRDWMLAGVALGFGLHGYTATRIVPLLLGIAVLFWWFFARERWSSQQGSPKEKWHALGSAALVPASTALGFLPLLRYSLYHPKQFWFRSVSRLAEGRATPGVQTFLQNTWDALLIFHFRGDTVWVNTVPGDPVLDRITGILFVLGVLVVLVRFWRRPSALYATLLVAVPILLLPSILALAWPAENPSVVRTGGAVPLVMLLAALPVNNALGVIERLGSSALQVAALTIVAGIILVAGWHNWQTYFVTYARQYARHSWNSTEIAAEIARRAPAVGGAEHVYIFSYPHWVDTRNVAFNMEEPTWDSVLFHISEVSSARPEPRAIIFNQHDRRHQARVKALWPNSCQTLVDSRTPGKEFVVIMQADYCSVR